MTFVEHARDGVRLRLFIQPRASRSSVVGVFDGRLKIRLAAPPVDGKANDALIRFLAKVLGVTPAAVSVTSGHRGRRKTVVVQGVPPEDAARTLGPDDEG